jgi:bidirectional [NiFe] hydrogenase diaphorase subunit
VAVKTLTINDRPISARESETILEAAQDAGIHIGRGNDQRTF